ncbi:MAG: hypothetical protein ACR2G7_12385 [Acidimicrobiales bacterium]
MTQMQVGVLSPLEVVDDGQRIRLHEPASVAAAVPVAAGDDPGHDAEHLPVLTGRDR